MATRGENEEKDAQRPLLRRLHWRDGDTAPTSSRARLLSVVGAVVLAAVLVTAAVAKRGFLRSRAEDSMASSQIEAFEHHFATKTAYWDQRDGSHRSMGRALRLISFAEAAREVGSTQRLAESRGMLLVQTQFVTRHGIRFPTLSPIQDAEALLRKLAPFTSQLPRWLRGYSLPYNESVEGELTGAGVLEMIQFAKRELAAHGRRTSRAVYAAGKYELSHTQVTRTKASAVAFVREYFENPEDVTFIERPKRNDTFLRFFDICERYQREVKRNASALQQMHAFAKSEAMRASVQRLGDAFGVGASEATITAKDLAAAFSACAFDVALHDIRDQWCSLFTPRMVETLEYDDDLKAFYQLAGGYPINYEIAAVLLQDVVRVMDERIAGNSSIEGAFRFAHAETTLPLMTLLGFGDKTPLEATASRGEIRTRGFRTSELAPFAANIEFRLYAQPREEAEEALAYFVQVLVNERDDVVVPGCEDVFCPLKTLKTTLWRRFLDDLDFETQCQVDGAD